MSSPFPTPCCAGGSGRRCCRWTGELETALFHRLDAKRCAVCGALFTPGSNRAKYCPECAGRMKRIKAAQRKRKQRAKCHALGAENPL